MKRTAITLSLISLIVVAVLDAGSTTVKPAESPDRQLTGHPEQVQSQNIPPYTKKPRMEVRVKILEKKVAKLEKQIQTLIRVSNQLKKKVGNVSSDLSSTKKKIRKNSTRRNTSPPPESPYGVHKDVDGDGRKERTDVKRN